MRPEELLGLPLEEALRRWAEAGEKAPVVETTADPRHPERQGTPRLVRVQRETGVWTAAVFRDADPE
ncbi:MAG: hypothetical protein IKH77_09005 [Clostridia bacterium]|nr:hypothetical protein [Clostridia bacterium]